MNLNNSVLKIERLQQCVEQLQHLSKKTFDIPRTPTSRITPLSPFPLNSFTQPTLIHPHKKRSPVIPQTVEQLESIFNELIQGLEELKVTTQECHSIQEQFSNLKRSQKHCERFFNYSMDLMAIAGLDGQIKLVNPAWKKTLGYTQEELEGKPLYELIHPDDIQPTLAVFEQKIKSNQGFIGFENRYRCKDGSYKWLSWDNVTFLEEGLCYGFAHDITATKEAEFALRQLNEELEHRVKERTTELTTLNQALYQREEELETILENTPDVIARYDKQLRHTYINPAIEREIGVPSRKFIGKTLPELDFPDSLVCCWESHFREVFTSQEERLMEFSFTGRNGIQFYEARIVPEFSFSDSVDSILSIVRNITARKQAEEEIRSCLEKEKELSELRSSFITMTSHEFRTPLMTIQTSTELLNHYRSRLSPEKQSIHLQRIQSAVARMTQMLNDILLISEAKIGKLEFQPKPINLSKFCCDLVEYWQLHDSNKHNIVLTESNSYKGEISNQENQEAEADISSISNLPTLPCLDKNLIQEILNNLISNSIKYSPMGSTIDFKIDYLENEIIFTIKDSGIGIPEKDKIHLFEIFHRATNVGTIPGVGLGLAIVKQCLDLHKGEISVISEVGKGTTFTVTLPYQQGYLI